MMAANPRGATYRYTLSALLCLCGIAFTTGCGGGGATPVSPLNLDTWAGTGEPPITPVVAGEVVETDGNDQGGDNNQGGNYEGEDGTILCVGVDHLIFTANFLRRELRVRNCGVGVMAWAIQIDVPWASATSITGTSVGEYDVVAVAVDPADLPSDDYVGQLTISTPDGRSHSVTLMFNSSEVQDGAVPPELEFSTKTLDFGSTATQRAFTLRNAGDGTLQYEIDANVDWLTVEPAQGEFDSSAVSIVVTADRGFLPIGDYETTLDVWTDAGLTATVQVLLNKPVTSPLIIPWIEVNQATEARIDGCVAGVEHWQYVTDTILVSTAPGQHELYTELRQRMPHMRIIPGVKSHAILGDDNFDSVEGWQQLAQSIADVMETSGETVVALEHESALGGYWDGEYEIDFDQLREGLSYLPDNVQILWYPVLLCNDARRSLCIPLMETVQDVLDCRLIDLTVCDPYRDSQSAKQALADLAEQAPLPIMYVGRMGSYVYWPYNRIDDMLELTEERPEILVYPGSTNWVLAAESIAQALR